MSSSTLAILHPGAMGAAVGACLRGLGHRVLWTSEGRSDATRRRADAAGLEDCGSLKTLVQSADIILSICPPHGALELAQEVAALGFKGIYVDANAISPDTAREVAQAVASAAGFVDGGIVGQPPKTAGSTRLYLCGKDAASVAALFEGSPLQAIAIDGPPGSASALKVCYAAWSKGATALLANIRALARHEGVEQALLDEWQLSSTPTVKRSAEVAAKADKAWRWVAEMEEIAASFAAAGLPPGFHEGAAEIYRRLDQFKDAPSAPDIDTVLDQLQSSTISTTPIKR